jgi:hypothetical protein
VTDFGFVPLWAGIPIGMIYALSWLYVGYRRGARAGQGLPATLYGCVSVLLALPVLVEAVTRFELLSGPQGAVALLVLSALFVSAAIARQLHVLAWLALAGSILTALALLRASGAAQSYAAVLLVLGLGSLWIVYLRHWRGLQWLGAAGANLGVILLAVLSLHESWRIAPLAAFAAGLVLWTGYLASFAVRTHRQGAPPGVFEAVQAVIASALAFGVAFRAATVRPGLLPVVGATALAFGVGAYALAFTPRTRGERGRSFYFYSSLGLVLVIGGSALLLPPNLAAIGWALLAVAMAWLSGRQQRVTLSLHCTLLLVAAALASGAFVLAAAALSGSGAAWPVVDTAGIVTAGAAVACLFIPVAQRSERWGRWAGLPQLVALLIAVGVVGGLMVAIAGPWLAGVGGESVDAGRLATLRTAVLAAAAVVLALSARYRRWPEARWLAYPVLVAVGIKLVLEDFPQGRPATLFLSLALVGGALILVSRLLPRREPAVPPDAAAGPGQPTRAAG